MKVLVYQPSITEHVDSDCCDVRSILLCTFFFLALGCMYVLAYARGKLFESAIMLFDLQLVSFFCSFSFLCVCFMLGDEDKQPSSHSLTVPHRWLAVVSEATGALSATLSCRLILCVSGRQQKVVALALTYRSLLASYHAWYVRKTCLTPPGLVPYLRTLAATPGFNSV